MNQALRRHVSGRHDVYVRIWMDDDGIMDLWNTYSGWENKESQNMNDINAFPGGDGWNGWNGWRR